MPRTPRSTVYALTNRLMDGALPELLQRWRNEGLSFYAMARRLEDEQDVMVSHETIRQWCHDLGIVGSRREAS